MKRNDTYTDLESGVNAVLDRTASNETPTLVLDAGGTCSGKRFFAELLKEKAFLRGRSVSIIEMDSYFRDIDDPRLPHAGTFPIFDVPEAYHRDEIRSHVIDLICGRSIRYPKYDIGSNRRVIGETELMEPGDIIVVDGLFAISELAFLPLSPYDGKVDILRVFIDASMSVRLNRRIKRDTRQFGIREKRVIEAFTDWLLPLHTENVEPQKNDADMIIINNA